MTRPLTEPLLRALVGEACADSGGACVLAVAAAPVWDAAPVLETGNGRARVVPCVSALAVREALRSRAEGETLVILTDRDEADLGQEVLARLWQQHVRRPSGWEALRHLFRVDGVDPALADHRWMVDLLVDIAPPRGYPPPPSGFLDLATAWRTLVRHGLRLDDERPSAADLLRWGLSEPAREASRGPLGPHLGLIGERLARDGVDLAPHVLRLVAAGRGEDLVAFGLVCDVLWSRRVPENPQVTTARIRFEGPLGARDLPPRVAQAWGAGAVELVRLAEEAAEPAVPGWLARTEHLLATDLDALELAAVSDVLPGAFGQRLGRAGRALGIVLDGPTDERLERLVEAADLVGRHLRAGTEPERVRALRMAVRLARRTVSPPALPAGDLGQLASQYVGDGAWVDAARDTLAEGETVEVLAEAYGRLAAGSDADRRRRDQAFAAAFAAWSTVLPSASRPLLPIERVLDEIVAPVARQAPTLLLVLDGLSHAEATRLLADVEQAGWTAQAPSGDVEPLVVAAVPTVTAVSRASLLSGRLASGDQEVERAAFSEHPTLRAASPGAPPRLFHKRDLGVAQGRIAPQVRDAVLDTDVRIVGVVVNAVDDHLAKGGQLRLAEGLAGVKPLRWLLEAAAEAGRVVVLTSDHGHVREFGSAVRPAPGAGERWRHAEPPASEDEVEIVGPRVLRGAGRVVAAGVEGLRYNPVEKHGYHGGAAPQEVLCPLAVLAPAAVTLAGWRPRPLQAPDWWDPAAAVPPLPELPREPEAAVDADGQPTLFAAPGVPQPSLPIDGWIGELLASPVLAEQRRLAGRTALDDDDLAAFLRLLDAAGGVAPAAALSRATGLPAGRLRSKLEALRRMLNVDGYPVLILEADGTARLDRGLLAAQFATGAR